MPRSIGSVDVEVTGDYARFVSQSYAAGRAAGEAAERGFDSAFDPDGDGASKTFWNGFDEDSEQRLKESSRKMWKDFDDENEDQAEKSGEKSGKSFAKRFFTAVAKIATFAEPVALGLQGIVGTILELGASLLQAVSAGAAFVPIAVALGSAFGAILIGSQGIPDALSAVNEEFANAVKEGRAFNIEADAIVEAMGRLAPAAQEFVGVFGEIRGALSDMQGLVQQALFTGLGDALAKLTFDQLPAFQTAMINTATAVSTFVQGFVDTLNAGTPVGEILGNLVPILSNILGALTPLTTAFLGFVQTATPFAAELATHFRLWADSLADFVTSAEGTAAIQGFLDRALDSLHSWMDLIGSVGRVIGDVMEIAGSRGDGLIDSITRITDKFDAWLDSDTGRDAFIGFLDGADRIMRALLPVVKGLGGFIDNLLTDEGIKRFEELAVAIGEILPFLGQLLANASKISPLQLLAKAIVAVIDAMEKSGAMEAFERLATVIGESLGTVIQTIVDSGILVALEQSLGLIADAASDLLTALFSNEDFLTAFEEGLTAIGDVVVALLPVLLQLTPALLGMVPVITSILELLPPLAELLMALLPAINFLTVAWVAILDVQAKVAAFIVDVLVVVLETLIGWLTSLVELLTGAVKAAIEGLSSAWKATTEDISEFWNRNVGPVITKIGEFATFIGDKFMEAKDAVVKAWNDLFEGVRDTTADITRVVSDAWTAISDTASEVWETIRDAITGTWEDLVSAFDDTVSDIQDFWDDLVGFVEEIPGRFGDALADVVDVIVGPFEDAYNQVKGWVDKIKGLPGSIAGGIGGALGKLPGLAAGGIAFGPQRRLIGEAGPEAVIPLNRPLSMIDPSVRGMAAAIQGRGGAGVGPGPASSSTTNMGATHNWYITDNVGNAEATAAKVVNRLVSVGVG